MDLSLEATAKREPSSGLSSLLRTSQVLEGDQLRPCNWKAVTWFELEARLVTASMAGSNTLEEEKHPRDQKILAWNPAQLCSRSGVEMGAHLRQLNVKGNQVKLREAG